ncbi:unnamed protein product [Lymnaea stagnalis]|uniref:Beta-1,4-N-acetylgalactosaminyltransferase bre-4 n=1 Tax=Lymnaea stagnalis TaxID=6523 RepID=A0AAV2HXY0_LYMST
MEWMVWSEEGWDKSHPRQSSDEVHDDVPEDERRWVSTNDSAVSDRRSHQNGKKYVKDKPYKGKRSKVRISSRSADDQKCLLGNKDHNCPSSDSDQQPESRSAGEDADVVVVEESDGSSKATSDTDRSRLTNSLKAADDPSRSSSQNTGRRQSPRPNNKEGCNRDGEPVRKITGNGVVNVKLEDAKAKVQLQVLRKQNTATNRTKDSRQAHSSPMQITTDRVPSALSPDSCSSNGLHRAIMTGQQGTGQQGTSTLPDQSASIAGQYTQLCPQQEPLVRHINLYEYEKTKPASKNSRTDTRSEYYGYYRDLHLQGKRRGGHPVDDEEDDQFNVFVCLLFCIMGIGVIIGLVILLCQYVVQQEQDQKNLGTADEDCVQLMNNVYQRRIADIIQSMATHPEQSTTQERVTKKPMEICIYQSPYLVGNTTDVNLNISVDFEASVKEHSDVLPGGEWRPSSCISRHRVAIIIPYRDRWNHLKVLLHYLLPTLKRQQIHFRIFVVEQFGNETFNKGRIMNAAFREALQLFDFQCVTFHDVDLVPEDDRNMYSCTEQPKHMSISIDKFQYTLPYQGLVGGVLMFRTDHFQLVNGYSNMYWGWGAEDDDMTTRILHRGLRIYRPPSNIARYKMVKHEGRKTSEVAVRMKLLRSAARRSKMEGLNNVQYKLLSTQTRELFTHFIVDIGHP